MSIRKEIQDLIATLTAQLENFKQVPDDRLEAWVEFVRDQKDNYGDERIETRELLVLAACLEADVRNADNIGYCGEYTDYYWRNGEWVNEGDLPEGDEYADKCPQCDGQLSPEGTGCDNPECEDHHGLS